MRSFGYRHRVSSFPSEPAVPPRSSLNLKGIITCSGVDGLDGNSDETPLHGLPQPHPATRWFVRSMAKSRLMSSSAATNILRVSMRHRR